MSRSKRAKASSARMFMTREKAQLAANRARVGAVAAISTRNTSGLILVLVVLASASVRADDVSGTWTGEVEVRGNYYWERSTRVVAPEASARVDAPTGTSIHAEYLIDSITSASLATGALTDKRFTELRHDARGGIDQKFELDDTGATALTVGAQGGVSTEPDYQSAGGGLSAALSFDHDATVLHLGADYLHDEVGKILRGADRSMGGRDLSNRGTVGTLDALHLSASVDQLLSPTLTFSTGYELSYLTGFQENPYRGVMVMGTLRSENHPDERYRHTLHGRLAWYIKPTHTALHAIYRAYLDNWDIAALTPEVRVYQEFGPSLQLRLRYRYYTQTRADFYKAGPDYISTDNYVTADPKMSQFHSQLLGAEFVVHLNMFENSPLDFLAAGHLALNFEYLWNTNRYGDGVIAQSSVTVPF